MHRSGPPDSPIAGPVADGEPKRGSNFIAGVLLFWFGSGPIRGFAVVLVFGLITSVFTALFLTRMWVAGYLSAKRPKDILI